MTILITIYLIGCVVAYVVFKKWTTIEYKKWTIGDRKFALFISIASWFTVVGILLHFLIGIAIDLLTSLFKNNNDKPAKW